MDIRQVAKLARLELTDAEATTYGAQLEMILSYVEQLKAVDVSSVHPDLLGSGLCDVLRADERVIPSLPIEAVLGNAPASAFGQIKMPKVIE